MTDTGVHGYRGHTMFAHARYGEVRGTPGDGDADVGMSTAHGVRGGAAKACGASEATEAPDGSEPPDGTEPSDVDGAALESAATQALRECLASNYDRLLRRLSRRIGCADTASDSLHEAWVRLGSATLPDAVHSAETYVFRMAYNLAVDQMRGRRMWASIADENEVFDALPDRGPGPEAVAGARSELAALARALEDMSGYHRRVLMELRVEDLTREEVAARHGLSVRKVDTLLRQTLDYCATRTGRTASGGISESRRPIRRGMATSAPKAATAPTAPSAARRQPPGSHADA